ncbi:MAG: HAD family hydrolase [Acidobacteria bacterium]|nr:HAD family hydrolase [Acidobacteriota bacterium]
MEILTPGAHASNAKIVLFDFDGTLSVIRSGWVETMVPMMVEVLAELNTGEKEEDLTELVREYVGRLTGKDTIYQMIELATEVTRRGGTPLDPLVYKRRYLDLLWVRIKDRVESLAAGKANPEQYLVPGARALLESLKERGLKMYLASGTDDADMKREAQLLDVARYFDGGCHGALDAYKSFSKGILVQRIIDSAEARGEQFLAFGDGFVEIECVKKVGGLAVGVATDEPECLRVDEWKRKRLVGVGADFIVPNFLALDHLNATLFPN